MVVRASTLNLKIVSIFVLDKSIRYSEFSQARRLSVHDFETSLQIKCWMESIELDTEEERGSHNVYEAAL